MMPYIAHVSTNFWCSRRIKSFLKPSQYTAQLLPFQHIGLIKHNNQLCTHRYPFTSGWREAIRVKCLAQEHKNISTAVAVGIRTHILITQPSEHKYDALNRSAVALCKFQVITESSENVEKSIKNLYLEQQQKCRLEIFDN